MSADSIVSIAWDVLKSYVVVPIKRRFEYVISSKSFADRLREEVQNLNIEADRVQILEKAAKNNVRNFHSTFTNWKASCEENLKEAQGLLDASDEASKTCCYGTLPDPKCRYQFSMKAEAEIKVIRELAEKCNGFKELKDICFIDPSPGDVTAMTSASSASTSIKLADYDIFESRVQIIRGIKDALADDSNSVVGVHGMGGLGKSTLLEEVKRMISEEKSFDWVAKANVSENPNIWTIQGEIADALGLTDIKTKETTAGRAELLQQRLKEESKNKKVLIILDNLWKGLDLKSVGIPCGHDNKVIGCKLLLTSRDRDILKSAMGCDKDFLLGELEEEEAKRLFEKFAGDKVHDNEFKPLVDEALHKCAGLPFLIVSMAKYFKGVGLPEWKIALKQIKLSKNKHLRGVINDMLQLSYDHLKGEEKSLLALCVVYGTSNPSFENLVRYGVGWGLFREDDNIEEARERLRLGIRTLQASSLLLENGDAYGFKIHDLVREFVASVAFRDHPLLVLKDKDKSIMELPKDKLKSCRAICFPYVDINELPQELDCPELQIFLLFTYDESLKVSYSLFYSIRKLMVLNLIGIHLTCFSSSFQFLENLRTLCLDYCSLDNVAILGELKGLEILSLKGSDIHQLPREIGQLANLRLLDLTRCNKLKIIESGVLRSLFKLEELYMKNSFDQWNVVEQTPPTSASLIELNHMKKLHTLHLSIRSPSMLPEDLNVEKLTKYEIRIGNAGNWCLECKGSRTLELGLDPLSDVLPRVFIQSISGTANCLLLDKFDGCEKSICSLSQNGFPKLKHLKVTNSSSIQYILRSPSHTYFETLELLLLENLITLEKICTNNISSKSFNTLKVVRVKSCNKMEVLFPLSILKGLPRLEEIEVVKCKLMRGIVEVDVCSKVKLHNLHVLKLCNLPDIKNFLDTKSTPSSSTSNDQVSTQIAFFNGQQVAFQRLETLEISGLHSLEFIFFPSMVRSLTQLKELTISYCEKTEAIIMEEEGLGMETLENLAFPMLTNLRLIQLKSLRCFSRGKCARESQNQDRVKSCHTILFNQECFTNIKREKSVN
ncbi:disease resistance protein At4g27190 [Eucalyptus grandis]|uniref:disease resistance protein At4g27190 n=1 Tax=Eucalyptus grandis TaxID=71139 RepID=UPI00192E7D94|nr:disease resistance protein At4g27190 [Eucalyptus grandis]